MPPSPILPPSSIDTDQVIFDHAAIYERMPHRFEFALLESICSYDAKLGVGAAIVDCGTGDWWTRGHIPGRPIFPGVLQLEASAQLVAFITRYAEGFDDFVAFGGVEDCRFRLAVEPPGRLLLIAKISENRPRRVCGAVQGFLGEQMAFHATITGLAMRSDAMSDQA